MSLYLRRLLAEFVDREHEMERFCRMLDNPEAFVFVVWGPGGVGKSSLQAKMIHEVANRSLVKSEVIWSETRNHDLMAITRKVRDDLGPKPFEAFTELINFFTVPRHELNVTLHGQPTIAVAEGASFADARVGDIGGVIIKDVMIQEPWRDLQTSESERRARLTDAFLDGAAAALAERTAVIFFDATEKMSAETEKWVWGELLPAVCDGRMGRAKFVLCGPDCAGDRPAAARGDRGGGAEPAVARLHPRLPRPPRRRGERSRERRRHADAGDRGQPVQARRPRRRLPEAAREPRG